MPYRGYDTNAMDKAVSAVRRKQLSRRKAAQEYGVPRSTLCDKLSGKNKGSRPGRERQLTDEEEVALVKYARYMANQGHPLTRQMIRCYIQEIVRHSGRQTLFNINKGPSDSWFRKFMARNPDLSERKPENLEKARAAMSQGNVVSAFFTFLLGVLVKYGLKDKPAQIFNCDETGFSGKEAPRTRVLAPRQGHVFRQRVTTMDHVTAHLCISASGFFLPTMVIYQGSLPHRKLEDGIPDSWLFATSESGYMDTDLFHLWFVKLFIPNCGRERPVLLVLDNHDSHISLKVAEAAIANDIVIVGLPAHTTHILQPLDVKVIGPLKARFSGIVANLGFTSAGLTIGKSKFPVVLRHSIDQATPSSIKGAFSATGICPFNPSAIDISQLINPTFESTTDDGNSENLTETCATCGSFLTNPLVARGLVPRSLSDILVPPPSKPMSDKPKRRRMVTEGRVISGDEMLKQLKEKEEMEIKKKEDSERKKKEAEERRVQKQKEADERKEMRMKQKEERSLKRKREEEERAEKRTKRELERGAKKQKAKPATATAAIVAASYVCSVCGGRGKPEDEANGVYWFGCDGEECQRWFHDVCLSLAEKELVKTSLENDSLWFCKICRPWVYEEE